MKINLEKANHRGHANHGWLDTYHSFSFANYYNPERMNFGALRVLNDDQILYGYGFDTHPHNNMEVITIPLKGALHHKDSTGKDDVIRWGQIQVMSTGTGIYHSEYNDVDKEPAELLQIWVIPNRKNTPPAYKVYDFGKLMKQNQLTMIIAPDGSAPASILQNAWFSIGKFSQDNSFTYALHGDNMGVYVFVISGIIKIDDLQLDEHDGAGIEQTKQITISVINNALILLIEVPM